MNNQLVCPNDELLAAAAMGEPESPEVSTHLAECTSCRQRVQRYQGMAATLRHAAHGTDDTTVPQPCVPSAERPAALGKYLVVGELGSGGQARVFRGLHPGLNLDVAIKWSHVSVAGDALNELNQEGKLLAELDHPGIVRVIDLDVHEGRPYLVREYVRGCDLKQYAAREKLSPRQAAELVARLARALGAAHARGIIHQDVKPGNVLMSDAGQVKLADFGLARLHHLWSKKDEAQPCGGTLGYMAPEQLSNHAEKITPATDLYGLGGVLFFLLTGKNPRKDTANPVQAWQQAEQGHIDWPALAEMKVPSRLVAICKKALDPDPARRYGRAEDLAADLDNYLDKPRVWRRRLGWMAAAVIFVAAMCGAYFAAKSIFGSGQNPIPVVSQDKAHIDLRIVRDGKDLVLKNAVPLKEGDKLAVSGHVPTDMKVALFAFTLTDPNLHLQELAPLKLSQGIFEIPKLFPLQGSPATEVLVLCGSTNSVPAKDTVEAIVAEVFPGKGGRGKGDLLLPELHLPVRFDKDKVHSLTSQPRLGAAEEDSRGQSALAVLEQMRSKLAQKFEFVSGLAFTHVVGQVPVKAQRGVDEIPVVNQVAQPAEGGTAEDREIFHEVMDKLLQTARVRDKYPAGFFWPPKVSIIPNTSDPKVPANFNAFAGPAFDLVAKKVLTDPGSGKIMVQARITEAYMKFVVKGDKEILAAIMGHELAHITLGHLSKPRFADLEGLAVNRQQEMDADLEGVLIAVAAGFPNNNGIRSAFREWKVMGDRSGFESITGTHPSWAERLAFLDRKQPDIWKAMAAFQNGYFFLHAEQYRAAESCFKSITDDAVQKKTLEEAPQLAEVWANLGYARLMQYCDALKQKDLRDHGIGQFVAGCFYERPESMVISRDKDEMIKLWNESVQPLQRSIELNPDLVLARANLGLAYLVHYDGKKTDKALEQFALAMKKKDKGLDGLNLAGFFVNYGVAELAAGQTAEADRKFQQAMDISLKKAKLSNVRIQLEDAILYNIALIDSASADRATRQRAFETFEKYLSLAGSGSTWWPIAYENYEKLGKDLMLPVKTAAAILAKNPAMKYMRPVTSIELDGGKLLSVSDPAAQAFKLLGKEKMVGIPIYPNAIVKRYSQAGPGISLLADDTKVLAIFLNSDKAPPIFVQPQGAGAEKVKIHVGMAAAEYFKIVKDQAFEKQRYIDDPLVNYEFLPHLGLAVRIANNQVSELVLAQLPRTARPQKK